jgi:ArsR family transcriptional regulator, cadmium/lead-responsive transcriptional repressor
VLTIEQDLSAITRLGRALADPTRCRILLVLLSGPAYPGQIAAALDLTRPNVSNHLTCLRGCGLVVAAPEGRQVRYELADPHLAHALRDLLDVVLQVSPHEDVSS